MNNITLFQYFIAWISSISFFSFYMTLSGNDVSDDYSIFVIILIADILIGSIAFFGLSMNILRIVITFIDKFIHRYKDALISLIIWIFIITVIIFTSKSSFYGASSKSTNADTSGQSNKTYCENLPKVDLDCADFSSHSKAQAFYEMVLECEGYDYHRLDGDDDGSACESL